MTFAEGFALVLFVTVGLSILINYIHEMVRARRDRYIVRVDGQIMCVGRRDLRALKERKLVEAEL